VIERSYFQMPTGSGATGECGIYLHYAKNYVVQNNIFEEIGAGQTNMAIYVNKSELITHQIYNNSFAGFYGAINALNNNSSSSNVTNGLKMNCNDFTPAENAFDISMYGSGTGLNTPSVMRKQVASFNASATKLVRNKYGSSNCGNWGKWYGAGAGASTLVIEYGCNSNSLSAGVTDPSGCSVSILSVTPLPINFNYGIDCGAGQYRSGGSTYTTQVQKLENINSYLAKLILQGDSADQFELQATATSKLNYFLMYTLPGAIDSVIQILLDNPGQMEDADIQ